MDMPDLSALPDADELLERVSLASQWTLPLTYAHAMAVGVSSDIVPSENPSSEDEIPGIVVIVFQGKLFTLAIADAYLRESPDVLTTLINATITNAYAMYASEHDRMLKHAVSVLETQGLRDGGQLLQDEMDAHNEL